MYEVVVVMCRVLAAVYQLPDGVYGTVSGILRGLGRQPQLLWVNLTGFWAVGMVVAVLLTFKLGFGEIGLWWGLLSGITATGAWRNFPLEAFHAEVRVCLIMQAEATPSSRLSELRERLFCMLPMHAGNQSLLWHLCLHAAALLDVSPGGQVRKDRYLLELWGVCMVQPQSAR